MKQRIIILFIILPAICFLSFSAVAKTYKIGVIPWVGSSPLDVADAKGFWDKQGINVKVLSFAEPQKMDAAMARGLLDIRYDMLGSAIDQIMAGNPYVIIAETDWSNGGDFIIVKTGIDPSNLIGKMVGVYMDKPSITYFLNKQLTTWGIELSDLKIIGMGDETLLNKFTAGLFPVMVHYGPYAMLAVEKGGGEIAATSATYPGCIPEGLLMKKDALKNTSSEDLIKILNGYIEAVKWIKTPGNMPAYIEILKNYSFKAIPGLTNNDIKEMVGMVALHDATTLKARNKSGGGLESYLTELHSFLGKNKILKKDFTTQAVFDNRIIIEALQ